MNTVEERTSYEVCVNKIPAKPDDLMTRYSMLVYRYIDGGVCGPFSEEIEVVGMGTVIDTLTYLGFEMVAELTVHTNYASAPLRLVA